MNQMLMMMCHFVSSPLVTIQQFFCSEKTEVVLWVTVNDFPSLAHVFVMLFGLMYALDLSSLKELDNTCDFTHKFVMGLEDGKLRPRVLSLKNELLSVEFPQCLNKAYKDTKLMSKVRRRAKVIQTSHCTKLAPPIQFPLDMLHCQERFHQEHVLPLPQRGRVCVSAFRTSSMTVRIRVISVEGLRDPSDFRPLTCSLTLSLTPGKLQRQHSAIIRNCHNPMFNEDFFFQEPEEQQGSLGDLALRLKVLDKASGLGRGVVLGIIIKPLCQLLPL